MKETKKKYGKKVKKQVKVLIQHPVFSSHWFQLVVIGIVSGITAIGGTYLTLSSFAGSSRPTATVTFITSEVDANGKVVDEIGDVTIVTREGGSGVACPEPSGRTDPAGGDNHGHLHLTCYGPLSSDSITYYIESISRLCFDFNIPENVHPPGSAFHISKGSSGTVLNLYGKRICYPGSDQGGGGSGGGGTTVVPPQGTPNGTLSIATYKDQGAGDSVKSGNELGGVSMTIVSGGSGVDCNSQYAVTDSAGHAALSCPAAGPNNTASDSRAYHLVGASKVEGGNVWRISPISPHKAYGSGGYSEQDTSTVHITGGQITTLSIVLRCYEIATNNVCAGSSPESGGSSSGTGSNSPTTAPKGTPNGSLTVKTYKDEVKDGNELGGVTVRIGSGGSGVLCSRSEFTTGVSTNLGEAHVTCPAASTGKDRAYKLISADKEGYIISSKSPHRASPAESSIFHVDGDSKPTVLSIVMARKASTATNGGGDPALPSNTVEVPGATRTPYCSVDSPTAGVSDRPGKGTGNVVVCAYDVTSGVSREKPLGGVEIHLDSVGADGPGKECLKRNRTTSPSLSDHSLGRATFKDCPIASNGDPKAYIVSYVRLNNYREADNTPYPSGCHDENHYFRVEKDKTKRISVYLTTAPGTAPTCNNHKTTIAPKATTAQNPSDTGGTPAEEPKEEPGPDPEDSPLRKRIIQVAASQVGYHETGTNNVKYYRSKGTKWCAIFVSWVWHVSKVPGFPSQNPPAVKGQYYTASDDIGNWAEARGSKGKWHDVKDSDDHYTIPHRGDAVLYGPLNNGQHVGIIEDVHSHKEPKTGKKILDWIVTIDGNATDAVKRSGKFHPKYARHGVNPSPISGYASPARDY